ncbi:MULTISPECIES: three-helix bundle dimerization domain-containing protein [unclassified Amycolatopsis]|uniref:three-helix bundle dimerization domain-containing protein n=1 Tax=unclassified Amycolatopsis TaxID=2618356 RepID=UPI0034563C89
MSTQTLGALAPEQPDAHFGHLEDRLSRDFATVGAESVHDLVERERARFTGAPVQAFVPILVERAVRAVLAGRQPA